MFRLKIILFLLLFYCSNFSVLAKTESVPEDHLHGLGDCAQCHVDGVDISKILLADQSCLTCHKTDELKTFVKKLASGEYASKNKSEKLEDASLLNNTDMYYTQTKIGVEPNKMVTIEAGIFTMGSDERLSDEGPQHKVNLSAFAIDIYEVTNGQYKQFIDATGRRSPSHYRNRTYPEGKVDHPVTFVNWEDAGAYCKWVGKRLPTDQEWEKAARGNDARTYPWGDKFAEENANTPLRWKSLGKFGDTTPVGLFPKGQSPHGLHDMSGNVWEWTSSWYKAYPENKTNSESYGERYKTLKGGSWFDCSFYKCGISAPVYNRAFFAKKVKNDTFGFRCAKDL